MHLARSLFHYRTGPGACFDLFPLDQAVQGLARKKVREEQGPRASWLFIVSFLGK